MRHDRGEDPPRLSPRRSAAVNEGLVDHLLACPEKDWFVPVPSDSTADLPEPLFEVARSRS